MALKKGPVRGSKTGRPIMALLDLLGRRWSLRILWELREEPLTFRELQARCDDVSPTSLNQRLKDLREAGLIERTDRGFGFTTLGRELGEKLLELDTWSKQWHKKL